MAKASVSQNGIGAGEFSLPVFPLFVTLLTIALVALGIFALRDVVEEAYLANRVINSIILVILAVGALWVISQIIDIFGAARWLRKYQSQSPYDRAGNAPALVASLEKSLGDIPAEKRISPITARSVLDSLASRMADRSEYTRYAARVLIFLGLLGTFWGLLATLSGVVEIVNALGAQTGGGGDVAALFIAMQEPLSGMGTAFSSSIFGIAGSLVLGFLDLLCTQSQNRLYNEVEEWVSDLSKGGAVGGPSGEASTAYTTEVLEVMVERLDDLVRVMKRAEESRARDGDNLKALGADLAASRDAGIQELRAELKTLANTIARLMEKR